MTEQPMTLTIRDGRLRAYLLYTLEDGETSVHASLSGAKRAGLESIFTGEGAVGAGPRRDDFDWQPEPYGWELRNAEDGDGYAYAMITEAEVQP